MDNVHARLHTPFTDDLSRNPVDVMMHADLSVRLQKAQQGDEGRQAIALMLSTGLYSDFKMKVYKAVGV